MDNQREEEESGWGGGEGYSDAPFSPLCNVGGMARSDLMDNHNWIVKKANKYTI